MSLETLTFTLPSWVLCPLFNDDSTGILITEMEELDTWLEKMYCKYETFYPVDTRNFDEFKARNDMNGLGGATVDVTFCLE